MTRVGCWLHGMGIFPSFWLETEVMAESDWFERKEPAYLAEREKLLRRKAQAERRRKELLKLSDWV